MQPDLILAPLAQHGFLGLSAVLLTLLVWLVRRLLGLLETTGAIIHENTQAIRSLDLRNTELVRLSGEMRDHLLARPCIAGRDASR